VVPNSTILIENPIAVTRTSRSQGVAQAFVDYLRSADGQRLWAGLGYRPIVPRVAEEFTGSFPVPADIFTIGDLGGWSAVDKQFFDRDNGVVAEILQELGRSGAR
jgi:sulfate transport system substrate-binding protein